MIDDIKTPKTGHLLWKARKEPWSELLNTDMDSGVRLLSLLTVIVVRWLSETWDGSFNLVLQYVWVMLAQIIVVTHWMMQFLFRAICQPVFILSYKNKSQLKEIPQTLSEPYCTSILLTTVLVNQCASCKQRFNNREQGVSDIFG